MDFFSAHEMDGERCKALQKLEEATVIAWERESASVHSPGPVEDPEVLYRQMLNPTHYDATNKILKATAFADTSDKGGSVNRANLQSYEEAVQAATVRVAQINERKPGGAKVDLWEIIELRCQDVRDISTLAQPDLPARRAFAVFDTALEDAPSHADICQVAPGSATGRSARSKLLDLANAYLRTREHAA
ncbi:hypothetical protein [Duganella sp. HH101]|uniref:hypothetical protein n=1 Tax=Duganella sp. HH101 TaxID=1781066 RepID=UPI00114CB579|nr:hypothetical protein [Duganella sp. HH101]